MNQQQLFQHPQLQRRRQSLLNRRVQEEFLIEQVRLRPVLYDKSLKAYRKPGATDNAWSEIGGAFGVKVEDCKKRWKSLRDTFIKYFRQELLAASAPGMKRKKWIYYEQMSFLRTHVELYGNGHYYSIAETDSVSDKDTIVSDGNQLIHIEDYDEVDFLGCEEEQFEDNQTEYIYEDVEEASPTICTVQESNECIEEVNKEPLQVPQETIPIDQLDQVEQVENMNIITTVTPREESSEKVVQNPAGPAVAITDPDERFLLSCAPVLKRLSIQKNALVKLKIQQLLYEVEFGGVDSGGCDVRVRFPK